MTILLQKYNRLGPNLALLSDPVVLAQAWKKAHSYIRKHNWYADTLELDCSATDLESRLNEWAQLVADGLYKPEPMRLVPAPKNAPWRFSGDANPTKAWMPKEEDQAKLVLRPLAHLGIREQTVTTAAMLCLADCIESAQGNPAEEFKRAASLGVFSYGNRLFCRWDDPSGMQPHARFPWGNADTYSRYFQDYQRFIERPIEVAQRVSNGLDDSESLMLIKLDLSAFYDKVDIGRLLRCLRKEYADYHDRYSLTPESDDLFWLRLEDTFRFTWAKADSGLAHLLKDGELPIGLPQGMVSSGFFANAYLLDFDRAVGSRIGSGSVTHDGESFEIHDYCRYVDDLRLVISTHQNEQVFDVLKNTVSNWIQSVLDFTINKSADSNSRMRINADKTELEVFSSVGKQSGVGARMQMLQHDLSGPFDMATLQQVATGLDGLLALAELDIEEDEERRPSGLLRLESVTRPKLDVRDDTLTRFAAYRLTKTLRLRRSMTDIYEETEGFPVKKALEHEFEVTARRLVSAWAGNPSLVQVLRYALDLFPSVELLEAVLEALDTKLSKNAPLYERYVVFYIIADLFRAGAVEIGWRATPDDNLVVENIESFRNRLSDTATAMVEREDTPWYVLQQALLYLAVRKRCDVKVMQIPSLSRHLSLLEMVCGAPATNYLTAKEAVSVSLVGHQLVRNFDAYVSWFDRFAKKANKSDLPAAIELLGQSDSGLLRAVLQSGQKSARLLSMSLPKYLAAMLARKASPEDESLADNKAISLAAVIRNPKNPFTQENALLKLAVEVVNALSASDIKPEHLTPLVVRVKCDNWALVQDARIPNLKVEIQPSDSSVADPRYATPSWCDPDLAWMYALGRLLRACATGELDFTARQFVIRETPGAYVGIRSTWHKRRFGMLHTAESLGGIFAPITPWFSELLLRMLQWPGLEIEGPLVDNWEDVTNLDAFSALIRKRLAVQANIFGVASNIPVYIFPVQFPLHDSGKLRVVLVQGLVPQENDFKTHGPLLDSPSFRARHRNHLASLMNLIHRKVLVHSSSKDRPYKPVVDLIVFPELSINPADEDLLRGLSDSTGAMVFCGMVGMTDPVTGEPINLARWMIPQRRSGRRSWVVVHQGKHHLTNDELKMGFKPWRPYQVVIELMDGEKPVYRISGAICYDATDIALAADLKDISHMFVVSAMNRDVKTFDSMVGALRFHMYQHVVLANSGEFGGSTAQAPYSTEHQRLIAHVHGNQQAAISVFEVDMNHFGPPLSAAVKDREGKSLGKTPPAGLKRIPEEGMP